MENLPKGSSNKELIFSRKDVFIMIKENLKDNIQEIITVLQKSILEKSGSSIDVRDDFKQTLNVLRFQIRSKWAASNRTETVFLKKNEQWLNGTVRFLTFSDNSNPTLSLVESKKKCGRPSQSFDDCSDRSKRRKTEELRKNHIVEELAYATQMSLRLSGHLQAAKFVKDVSMNTSKASDYVAAVNSESEETLSPDEALSVLIEYRLSKRIYQSMRNIGKEKKCKLYPSYIKVVNAKTLCCPPPSTITVTETCAEVKLQALLDHTTERLLLFQKDVIDSLTSEILENVTLYCKWGCDGSSGQSVYKQKFSEDGKSDESVFFCSLVPLQLIGKDVQTNKQIVIWKNQRPSSSRFCRPLKLQFEHENVQSTVKLVSDIEEQIAILENFTKEISGNSVSVTYNMSFTMIDGKVCNAVTGTKSAQRCFLCKATSKEFNKIDDMTKREIDINNLKFGISILHAWIRFFECVLHLSYKLETKQWQARKEDVKQQIAERKRDIQEKFRSQLGLVVDRPKPGYGSSNDGNTARRFFEHATTSAAITGVDESLIHQLHIILQTISSGYAVDCDKFREYGLQTARKFVELYPWYYMPTTLHKILIHGPEIISHALLPIGQLSEEAQETRNKDIKRFRENFSRKSSRVANMQDVFNRLLITSDPYISSIRKLPQKPLKSLSPECVALLISPEVTADLQDPSPLDVLNLSDVETDSVAMYSSDEDEDFCF